MTTGHPGESGSAELDVRDGVATITIDRSHRHNSLVPEFLEHIEAAIAAVAVATDASVVVVRAAGSSFSTGGDIAGFATHGHDLAGYADRIVGALNRVILGLIRLDQPVVVAVHGMVTGGSLGLVLAGDVVLVCPDASFTPWYRIVGFSPDGGWTAMLPHIIGHHRAADVLMTNRTIDPDEALAWGLAARIVATEDIHAEADRMARHIAEGSLGSIRHTKRRLWADADSVTDALEDERRRFVEQVITDEVASGIARFLGGRQ